MRDTESDGPPASGVQHVLQRSALQGQPRHEGDESQVQSGEKKVRSLRQTLEERSEHKRPARQPSQSISPPGEPSPDAIDRNQKRQQNQQDRPQWHNIRGYQNTEPELRVMRKNGMREGLMYVFNQRIRHSPEEKAIAQAEKEEHD